MPSPAAPVIVWFRHDLRLKDHPALHQAAQTGRTLILLFVLDDTPGRWAIGGAARWWLHGSLESLAAEIEALGGSLTLRRGNPAAVIASLAQETGATTLHAGLGTEPQERAADRDVDALGIETVWHRTYTLHDPDAVRRKTGGVYGVFTPFARACRIMAVGKPLPAPDHLAGPKPASDRLDAWRLRPEHPDWAGGLRDTWSPGASGAAVRAKTFAHAISAYDTQRNIPGEAGTSMLSPHLAWGEISPRALWHAALRQPEGSGRETWLTEILWREFAAYLLWHHPSMPDAPLKPEYGHMPFRDAPADLAAWQQGKTGIPIVDAGMRQLWHTGWMHNRVRMITASFLVKHLLLPWQAGEAWFWDTLVDASLASNSVSWQWVAGCGADAAPFFRIFNPVLQGQKFDPSGAYVRRHVPELAALPDAEIHAPSPMVRPRGYPAPIVDLAHGRERALAALKHIRAAA